MAHRRVLKWIFQRYVVETYLDVFRRPHIISLQTLTVDNVYPEHLSGRRDSNPGPLAPKASALTGLRYAPITLQNIAVSLKNSGRQEIIPAYATAERVYIIQSLVVNTGKSVFTL